jgi:hypothetical protein
MKTTDAEFLQTKLELFAREMGDRGDNFLSSYATSLAELKRAGTLTRKTAISFDQGVEVLAGLWGKHMDPARQELRARFGADRLSKDPDVILKRVLKRGSIKSDAEAEIVRTFVINQANEAVVGRETFQRLAEILDHAGY